LNFVGGKNILVPSDRATIPEAKSICGKQGLELMSLDSLAQMDSVQDFLGDIGLSSSTLLTSMKKVTDGGNDWLGDLASALVPPKDPSKDGDCMGLNSIGLVGISCDMVSNFVCQAPDPGAKKPSMPSLEFVEHVFSVVIRLLIFVNFSDIFSSFLPAAKGISMYQFIVLEAEGAFLVSMFV
jgi:hypothetical protein